MTVRMTTASWWPSASSCTWARSSWPTVTTSCSTPMNSARASGATCRSAPDAATCGRRSTRPSWRRSGMACRPAPASRSASIACCWRCWAPTGSPTCWPSISRGDKATPRYNRHMADDIDYARYDRIRPIRWTGDALELLDQRKLPFATEYVTCRDSDEVAAAIHALAVRGAPAIGIAAAWGTVLAARDLEAGSAAEAAAKLEPALQRLNAARPTAVNLGWALARMRAALARASGSDWRAALEKEAAAIEREDLAANRRMGSLGAALIEPGSGVLTHCNTGSLATAGFG